MSRQGTLVAGGLVSVLAALGDLGRPAPRALGGGHDQGGDGQAALVGA